ncbi:MAG: DNA-processing protein DprA [Ilumatobacteraceae bacterium]
MPADVDACGDLDEDALRTGQLAALSSLEGLGQRRLGALLVRHQLDELVRCIANGTVALHDDGSKAARSDVTRWRAELGDDAVTRWAQRCRSLGVRAVTPDEDEFPCAVRLDERPPPVLFVKGAMPSESMRHAAIVGTRNASSRGREFARHLGRELATSGVVVVSGLARGIDAAAHRGALDAPDVPLVGVIGNGHGTPYPHQNAALWDEVAAWCRARGVATGHTARCLPVPTAQPHRCGVGRGRHRGREPRDRRQPHHRARRCRARRDRDGRPLGSPCPLVTRHQRAHPRRCRAGDVHRRRPRRDEPLRPAWTHPFGRSAAPPAASRPTCSSASVRSPAHSISSSPSSASPSRARPWPPPASSGRAG